MCFSSAPGTESAGMCVSGAHVPTHDSHTEHYRQQLRNVRTPRRFLRGGLEGDQAVGVSNRGAQANPSDGSSFLFTAIRGPLAESWLQNVVLRHQVDVQSIFSEPVLGASLKFIGQVLNAQKRFKMHLPSCGRLSCCTKLACARALRARTSAVFTCSHTGPA